MSFFFFTFFFFASARRIKKRYWFGFFYFFHITSSNGMRINKSRWMKNMVLLFCFIQHSTIAFRKFEYSFRCCASVLETDRSACFVLSKWWFNDNDWGFTGIPAADSQNANANETFSQFSDRWCNALNDFSHGFSWARRHISLVVGPLKSVYLIITS